MSKEEILEYGKVLREEGFLTYRDLYVLMNLVNKLNFDTYVDFRNKTLSKLLKMDKSSFSKSKKNLLKFKLIIEKEDAGFKLNDSKEDIENIFYKKNDLDFYL